MKEVKPILFGLLWGVYEKSSRWIHDDCSFEYYKLITIHFTKQNAENSIK